MPDGEVTEFLAKNNLASPELLECVGFAESVYSKVSWVYAAVEAGKEVMSLLGFGEEEANPLDLVNQKLTQILVQMEEIKRQLAEAAQAINELADLNAKGKRDHWLAQARALQTATWAYLSIPSEFNELAFKENAPGVDTLGNEGIDATSLWLGIRFKAGEYRDAWSGFLEPLPEGGHCWDFRPMFEIAVYGLHVILLVHAACDEGFRKSRRDSLERYMTALTVRYSLWLNKAIQSIRPPTPEELPFIVAATEDAHFFSVKLWPPTVDFAQPHLVASKVEPDFVLQQQPWGGWRLADYRLGAVETNAPAWSLCRFPVDELREALPLVAPAHPPSVPPSAGDLLESLVGKKKPKHNEFEWAGFWQPGGVKVVDQAKFDVFVRRFMVRHALRTLRQERDLRKKLALEPLRRRLLAFHELLDSEPPPDLTADCTSASLRAGMSRARTALILASGKPQTPPEAFTKALDGGPVSLRELSELSGTAAHFIGPNSCSLRAALFLDENVQEL